MPGQQGNDAVLELLKVLSTEIARDGGATRVNLLKDYIHSRKLVNKLLRQCTGSNKLLSFLERHPDIFHVDRPESDPHVVTLKSDHYVSRDNLLKINPGEEDAEDALRNKIIYVIRKQIAKQTRRAKGQVDRKEFDLDWLVKACAMALHFFCRATGYYQVIYKSWDEAKQIGTTEWQALAVIALRNLLHKRPVKPIVMDEQTGYVWLEEDSCDERDIQQLTARLIQAVEKDGGTNTFLSLLLCRDPVLQSLLGGRDLLKLCKDHEAACSDLCISKVGSDLHLQSSKSIRAHDNGRLQVDEVGLFSVTSSKWGAAMANILSEACFNQDMKVTIAIDLTASVGGITLALARTFSQVIAVEIDSHRAELCRQNMIRLNLSNVKVRNDDSVTLIPELAAEIGGKPTVIVIDPPWGGSFHKRERPTIALGSALLEDVISSISEHFFLCFVGLKLPVHFPVRDFADTLRVRKKLTPEIVTIRKLGPQLFLVFLLAQTRRHQEENEVKKMSSRDECL